MSEYDTIRYRWTDAWLLAAVDLAAKNQPAELWQIILSGDNLNHALFTDEELESGLARLTQGRWITESTGRFSTTDLFKQRNIKITGFDSIKKIERLLDAEPWTKGEPMPHPANNLRYPGITREILFEANQKCAKEARAEINRLLGRRKQ